MFATIFFPAAFVLIWGGIIWLTFGGPYNAAKRQRRKEFQASLGKNHKPQVRAWLDPTHGSK